MQSFPQNGTEEDVFQFERSQSKVSYVPCPQKNWENLSFRLEYFRKHLYRIQDPVKQKCYETQLDMIKSTQKIKQLLGLDKASPYQALEEILTFQSDILPNISHYLLLKYPETVSIFMRLKKYVGNADEWKLSQSALLEFEVTARKIRLISDQIDEAFKVRSSR